MKVNIDWLTTNSIGGSAVAQKVMNDGLHVNNFRPFIGKDGRNYISVYTAGDPKLPASYTNIPVNNAATLRKDEWKILDKAVYESAESRLQGVADLKSRNLTMNLANGMASTVYQYQDISDALDANISMDGNVRGQNDAQEYTIKSIPLPIIHVDYEINERVLRISRKEGNGIDTNLASRAARKIGKKMEDLLFTDTSYTYGGGTIYSYLNAPYRNEVSLTADWASATAAQIIADCLKFKKASLAVNHFGPWVIYIPVSYETVMDKDYDTSGTSTQTIRERILKISGIEDIKVVDTLPTKNVMFIEMNSETVRWITGMPITNVQWSCEGGMNNKFKVMTIQLPQIRADYENQCGITHGSIA